MPARGNHPGFCAITSPFTNGDEQPGSNQRLGRDSGASDLWVKKGIDRFERTPESNRDPGWLPGAKHMERLSARLRGRREVSKAKGIVRLQGKACATLSPY
jgi:hypothetical protein